MSDKKSKALAIGYLMKVTAGNVNASHTEGNVMVTKKVTMPDGSTIPYISGQAIRRMLRDRLEDLGWKLSEPFSQVTGQEVTPPVRPWEFIDEDLFGYMDTRQNRRRTSPVRVSAAVGLFRYQGDRDWGTRSFEKFGQRMEAGGNVFETELYNNVFRGNLLIELDRVGRFQDLEVSGKDDFPEDKVIKREDKERNRWELVLMDANEKARRITTLLDALELLWGGGRTARMLTDLSPRFFSYARLTVKHPVFLEALSVQYEDGAYILDTEILVNTLKKFSSHQEKVLFGLEPGFFQKENEDKIRKELKEYGEILTVHEAIQKAREDVESLWKSSK